MLGWKDRKHANRIIQVYEGVIARGGDHWSPGMTFSMMRLLAAKNTPQQLVDEVIDFRITKQAIAARTDSYLLLDVGGFRPSSPNALTASERRLFIHGL